MDSDRIAISGSGWITPRVSGHALTALREWLSFAESAPEEKAWRIPDGALAGLSWPGTEWREDRTTLVTAAAIELALLEAGRPIDCLPAERIALVFGGALSGQRGMIAFAEDVRSQSARFVSPLRFPQTVGNFAAGALARLFHVRGPNMTVARGVASGLEAVVAGCRLIRDGQADLVLAGGTDTLTEPNATALAARYGRIAEGACWFVLERFTCRAVAHDANRRRLALVDSWGECPAGTTRAGARRHSFNRNQPDGVSKPTNDVRTQDRGKRQSHETSQRPPSIAVSVAGGEEPGAVRIEDFTRCCLAASGAAAIVGAIGILHGLRLSPMGLAPSATAPEPAPNSSPARDGDSPARLPKSCAVAIDGSMRVSVELSLPNSDPARH